jgi:hypothetical protein
MHQFVSAGSRFNFLQAARTLARYRHSGAGCVTLEERDRATVLCLTASSERQRTVRSLSRWHKVMSALVTKRQGFCTAAK